jgi:hypothetical protein
MTGASPAISSRVNRIGLPWALAAVAMALALSSFTFILLTPERSILGDAWGFRGYDALFALVYAVIGGLVASRQPRNIVGWLFLASAVVSGIQTVGTEFGDFAGPRWPELAAIGAWVSGWIWIPAVQLIALILLLFPDGRLVSPRWRPFVFVLAAIGVIVTLLWAVAPPEDQFATYPALNPLGLPSGHFLTTAAESSLVLLSLGLLGGVVSLVARMRRGDYIQRQQVKWLALAALMTGVSMALMTLTIRADPLVWKLTQILAIAAVMSIPVAAGIAILRYRLYDIDLLINRALVYGALSAVLVVAYLGSVIALQWALSPVTAGSQLAVAGSTLAVVAAVQPLRRRIQDAVDRRFYRSRYNAQRTLERFGTRLRDELDLDALNRELIGVVRETVQPAHASLWLRGRRQ